MITVKISTEQELEQAWPILSKLGAGDYHDISTRLPRFINIHRNLNRGFAWTHGTRQGYYNYPLLDISALCSLEETNPELFI